ncbi:MAG: tRNA lysidine(34) synthetase TilS [Faecalibacterium sp.]
MEARNDFKAILDLVSDFCAQEDLLTPHRPGGPLQIAAAVSGGADSIALLYLLWAMEQQDPGLLRLSACHVNHGLRGESADRDEFFVRSVCAELGVPLRVFHAAALGSVPSHAGEDWARRLRYHCFARLRTEGIDRIATAHTATDQAETLLFRLARGTGLHGAGGIRPMREGFIRPLLCLTRAQTEACCRALGQPWVTDETNRSDAYARNRLRHGALPALRSANTEAERNLARFCEKAARADAYFARQARQLLETARRDARTAALPSGARYALVMGREVFALAPLQAADPLILESAMHLLASSLPNEDEADVQRLCALAVRGNGAAQLRRQVLWRAGRGVLWREIPPEEQAPVPPLSVNLPVFRPGQTAEYHLPGGWRIKMELFPAWFPEKTHAVHKKDLKNVADYARITTLHSDLQLRSRKPGDRFRPAGRGISKELRKWMNEAGVPPLLRGSLPLLAAGSQVLWVCGEGFADGLAPDADSVWILRIDAQIKEDVES